MLLLRVGQNSRKPSAAIPITDHKETQGTQARVDKIKRCDFGDHRKNERIVRVRFTVKERDREKEKEKAKGRERTMEERERKCSKPL